MWSGPESLGGCLAFLVCSELAQKLHPASWSGDRLTNAETGLSDCHAATPPPHSLLPCSLQSPQMTRAALQDQARRYPLAANSTQVQERQSHLSVTHAGDALDLYLPFSVTAPNSSV